MALFKENCLLSMTFYSQMSPVKFGRIIYTSLQSCELRPHPRRNRHALRKKAQAPENGKAQKEEKAQKRQTQEKTSVEAFSG